MDLEAADVVGDVEEGHRSAGDVDLGARVRHANRVRRPLGVDRHGLVHPVDWNRECRGTRLDEKRAGPRPARCFGADQPRELEGRDGSSVPWDDADETDGPSRDGHHLERAEDRANELGVERETECTDFDAYDGAGEGSGFVEHTQS